MREKIGPLRQKKQVLSERAKQIERDLNDALEQEKKAEIGIKYIEEKEHMAISSEKKRWAEQQRQEEEENRKTIEQKRKELEETKKDVDTEFEEIKWEVEMIEQKADRFKKEIKSIYEFLSPGQTVEEQTVEDNQEQIEAEKTEENLAEQENEESGKEKQEMTQREIEEQKEKELKIQKIEEAQEMERVKEMRRKELEEAEEKKKADAQRIEGEVKRMDLKKPVEEGAGDAPKVVFRPLPKKPSMFEKVWVRAAAIILLIALMSFVIGFWYWYTVIKGKGTVVEPTEQEQQEQQEEEQEEQEQEQEKEIQEPLSLISVERTKTFEVDGLQNIPKDFSDSLEGWIIEDGFTRVLIKSPSENKFADLEGFLESFEIYASEHFYEKLSQDYTLFIYLQDQGERIGFVSAIDESDDFGDLLKTWEPYMEDDFEDLFTLMGNRNTAISSSFKTMHYKGDSIRYLTYSKYDLGICYAVSSDYFVWATSAESIKRVIDRL